jgi:hypothetical protein
MKFRILFLVLIFSFAFKCSQKVYHLEVNNATGNSFMLFAMNPNSHDKETRGRYQIVRGHSFNDFEMGSDGYSYFLEVNKEGELVYVFNFMVNISEGDIKERLANGEKYYMLAVNPLEHDVEDISIHIDKDKDGKFSFVLN